MKHIVVLLSVLFSSIFSLSAQQDAIDAIAEKTCGCLKNMDQKSTIQDIETELGLCMIREAAPYEKELKKKNHIDLSNLDGNAGEALGKLIATKMLIKCPDQMTRLANAASDAKASADAPAAAATSNLTGTITDISSTQFVVITVKDAKGPDQKFLWLGYFKGSELLKNGMADVKGKTVQVSYTESDIYNPAIKDYMKYKIITGLSAK